MYINTKNEMRSVFFMIQINIFQFNRIENIVVLKKCFFVKGAYCILVLAGQK